MLGHCESTAVVGYGGYWMNRSCSKVKKENTYSGVPLSNIESNGQAGL